MNAKSVRLPTPEDLATERLVAAVQSAIGVIQERLANLAADGQDANWSVSDLVRLLQLRNQLQGERPRTVFACWVDDPQK
jgi:predicted metal-dependent hydrolase